MSHVAYLYDEEDARRAADRLRAGGFGVEVVRGRFAGEDDDEDQPWVVSTDAPFALLEIAVEEYDGWVEDDVASSPPGSPSAPPLPPPLSLPTVPIRGRDEHGDG